MATTRQDFLEYGCGNLTTAAVTVAYTGTAGRTAQLPAGIYRVTTTTDAHVLQGGSSVTATASSTFVAGGFDGTRIIVKGDSDDYVSAIQASAGGSVFCTLIAPL